MAILNAPTSSSDGPITGWPLGDTLCPPGQQLAVCLGVKDTLRHERPTFEDPTILEKVDLTRFLFGLLDGSLIQTGEMKISSHDKSRLVGMLTGWLGVPPKMDGTWDYESMTGQGAQLNVIHKVSRTGRTYADIASRAPVRAGMEAQVPAAAAFAVPESAPAPAPAQTFQPPVAVPAAAVPVQDASPAPAASSSATPTGQTNAGTVPPPAQQQPAQTVMTQFTPPPAAAETPF